MASFPCSFSGRRSFSRLSFLSLALVVAGLVTGCGKQQAEGPGGAAGARTAVVSVQPVVAQQLVMEQSLVGRTAAHMVSEVRPQVGGIVQKRLFREGGDVKAGELLYQIDPALYQASFDSASATLAKAEANVVTSRLKAQRYQELIADKAVSQQAADDAKAALLQAEADVAAAKAAVEAARINLAYTRIVSPIAGRISKSAVTQGALLTANQATPLATVQQLDPIYVDLTQSSADMLRIRRDLAAGTLQRNTNKAVPVTLTLEDGSEYGSEGSLAFSEVTVDESTGSVTLRAKFPNPKGVLLPGMYVRARLPQGVRSEAILVPHAALTRDPRGNALVMVVDAESKVQARPVKVVQSLDSQWVVTDGLQPGERIIVEGLQKIRPGASVQAEQAQPAPATTSAAPAAK